MQPYATEVNSPALSKMEEERLQTKVTDKMSPRELLDHVYTNRGTLLSLSQLENSEEALKTSVEEEQYLKPIMESEARRKRAIYVAGKATKVADLCGYRGVLSSRDLKDQNIRKFFNRALN